MNRLRVDGEGNGTPLQYSCLENPMDGGARWAAVHGVARSQTWLSDFTFTFHFHALEKEMATHSSVLAWRIPGMGKPGGLPSMGSHSRTRLKRLSSRSSRRHKGSSHLLKGSVVFMENTQYQWSPNTPNTTHSGASPLPASPLLESYFLWPFGTQAKSSLFQEVIVNLLLLGHSVLSVDPGQPVHIHSSCLPN